MGGFPEFPAEHPTKAQLDPWIDSWTEDLNTSGFGAFTRGEVPFEVSRLKVVRPLLVVPADASAAAVIDAKNADIKAQNDSMKEEFDAKLVELKNRLAGKLSRAMRANAKVRLKALQKACQIGTSGSHDSGRCPVHAHSTRDMSAQARQRSGCKWGSVQSGRDPIGTAWCLGRCAWLDWQALSLAQAKEDVVLNALLIIARTSTPRTCAMRGALQGSECVGGRARSGMGSRDGGQARSWCAGASVRAARGSSWRPQARAGAAARMRHAFTPREPSNLY